MTRPGADLALLLLAGFRTLADRAHIALEEQGYADVRPIHDFALRAIMAGADTPSELSRSLSVSRQAAAKTVAVLEERGLLRREADPRDGRRLRLRVTERGLGMMKTGEGVFDDLRRQWEQQSGAAQVATLEAALRELVGENAISIDAKNWSARDVDDS